MKNAAGYFRIFYLFSLLFVKGNFRLKRKLKAKQLLFIPHDIIIIRDFFSEGMQTLFCSLLLSENSANEAGNDSPVSSLSFEELYSNYATDVLRVAYYYLGDRQRAEDVTQDVFVKLLTTRPELISGREKSWLLKVALNRCRDLWRSSWIKKVVLGHPCFELFPADDEIGRAADAAALAEAVNRLPADFKEVVLLHYYQGYSVIEISEMLEIAEGTVSSRLSRARTRMSKYLKGE